MVGAARFPDTRFSFGSNWQKYLEVVDDTRIAEATKSLRTMLRSDDLKGLSFLDAGSGSGLFSLAAAELGAARVHSFDYDSDSVACTLEMKRRYRPDDDKWTIEHGDITDAEYCESLGTFDVVYSWGVVHHTGAMWRALGNACERVSRGGLLFISIYNDQGRKSAIWSTVKRTYNRLPPLVRPPFAILVMLPSEVRMAASALVRGDPQSYVRRWTDTRARGMSGWHDLVDWVGGYPFEVARPEEVFRFARDRGFHLVELTTAGPGIGCNQFVFERSGTPETFPTQIT